MKKILLFIFLLSFWKCQNANRESNASAPADGEPTLMTIPEKSAAEAKMGSPELLRNFIRKTLRTELDFTVPSKQGDVQAKKSYSFDLEENNRQPTWVVKEKYHDLEGKLFAGAEYQLLWEVVDKNAIHLINSADGKTTAIRIRPTQGNTFLYHPYSNDPDSPVHEVVIGWFERTQDQTLLRAYEYLKMLSENMEKYSGE